MAHVDNCVWPALGRLPQLDQRIDLTSAPRRRSRRDGASLVTFSARYRQPPSARGQAHAKHLVTERLDERHVTAQEAGRGLGDDLLNRLMQWQGAPVVAVTASVGRQYEAGSISASVI